MHRSARRLYSKVNPNSLDVAKTEMIIRVNRTNKILGSISKYDAHLLTSLEQQIFHRAFSLFVIDKDDNLLVQQRSKNKVLFPLHWSNSVCSHPLFNDAEKEEDHYLGVRRAAIRRLQFELNIKHENIDDYSCIDSYLYQALGNEKFGESECELNRRPLDRASKDHPFAHSIQCR